MYAKTAHLDMLGTMELVNAASQGHNLAWDGLIVSFALREQPVLMVPSAPHAQLAPAWLLERTKFRVRIVL